MAKVKVWGLILNFIYADVAYQKINHIAMVLIEGSLRAKFAQNNYISIKSMYIA
ncbi:hypothetical protein CFB3_16590 [Clostridium folliculivorans]|uniref:Uncharacterized protein n=1 Tax=Clostridium folliculivorans TaxID=2886038 RepID=A0A9W5XYM6_9CLOT|nr:hypothetical protein CFOLD11_02620 [Clostridium folliculivorans]GKU29553.1 hypothetical protein CFB3_16590 [Clostridium folliculivorans]